MEQAKTPEQKISTYENRVKKSYSELGNEGVGIENWGTMITHEGKKFNGYTDKRFIKYSFTDAIERSIDEKKGQIVIADLGGDDGFLLNEVLIQLKEKNPDIKINGLVVDIDSTGKAREKFTERQAEGERSGIEYVVADITQLPFDDDSLDIVISRMTVQYLGREQQMQFLKEISRVLKKDGLCLIQAPTSETGNENYNEIWMRITKMISKSSEFKRRFPWFGEFAKYTDVAKQYGLMPVFGSVKINFPFSVAAFAERFHIDSKELDIIFQEEAKRHPEQFETIDGMLCLKSRLLNLRLKKT